MLPKNYFEERCQIVYDMYKIKPDLIDLIYAKRMNYWDRWAILKEPFKGDLIPLVDLLNYYVEMREICESIRGGT